MLNELLVNNKVVFAHVQRTVYGLNDYEDGTEDYLFKTPSSKYYRCSRGEWLTLYNEKEDGELSLRQGLPFFNIIGEKNFCRISIPVTIQFADKDVLWTYSPEAKMLRISWSNKVFSYQRKIKIEGMAEEEIVDEVIDVMLFFEDNEFLAKYRDELDSTDIPKYDKCIDVKEPADECNLKDEERVKHYTSIADEFKRNKRYRQAAKHYYKAYLINHDDSLLVKVFNLVKIMKQYGEDIRKLFAEMDAFRAPAFKFETDKEETSIGDVEFNNVENGRGKSSSDIPEECQLEDIFKKFRGYVAHDLLSMSTDLQKNNNIVSFLWQKLYKPDNVEININTNWK